MVIKQVMSSFVKLKLAGIAVCLLASPAALAGRYWPASDLIEWTLSLNNGVAYITSPQVASHCSYARAQINMSGTEFDKALYAFALSAKARGKRLRYVVDSEQTVCVISGLSEKDA